jgi:type II secretory pathway pseudopilin PulG
MQRFRRTGTGEPKAPRERGETLIEVLFAISILSFAVVTIVGLMGVAIKLSTRHRQQTTANTYLVNAAENVKAATYVPCQNSPAYAHGLTLPSGWHITVSGATAVEQPNLEETLTPPTHACPGADTKVEQVNVQVQTPTGYRVSTDVIKRCKNIATANDGTTSCTDGT